MYTNSTLCPTIVCGLETDISADKYLKILQLYKRALQILADIRRALAVDAASVIGQILITLLFQL